MRRVKRRACAAAAGVLVVGLALLAAPALSAVEKNEPCPHQYTTPEGYRLWAVGCYEPSTDTIYYETGHALWHERGHEFDHKHLSDSDRDWLRARYFNNRPWYGNPAGDAPARELFAEGYAWCMGHRPKYRRNAGDGITEAAYGYRPHSVRHRQLCNTISILRLIRG